MDYHLDNQIPASVFLWLDYVLVEENNAFKNYSGVFNASTTKISGWSSYAAPHRQFVYDSSVPNSIVPTGYYVGPNFNAISATGRINYNQGSVVLAAATSQTVSGSYSYKEVNIYPISRNEEEVLFDGRFKENSPAAPTDRSESQEMVVPCILIGHKAGTNETICFEGLSSVVPRVRLTVLTDNQFLFTAITATLRDKKETFIPIFNPQEMPFNFYGGLVSGSYDYSAARIAVQTDTSRLAYIKEVYVSPFNYDVNMMIGDKIVGGFVDLDLEFLRFPRL